VTTEPLSFTSAAASGTLQINGTLFLPAKSSAQELPSIVLISGSGPNNRYESVLESFFSTEIVNPKRLADGGFCYFSSLQFQPFYDIAAYLAEHGYAVYTYDKRTCMSVELGCHDVACSLPGQSNCFNVSNLEFEDFITDGVNAVKAIRGHSRISSTKVAVVGHSQGTTVAAYVAEAASVNKVVLLMGPGSDITGTFIRQANHLVTLSGNILNESLCDAGAKVGKEIMNQAAANSKLAKETLAGAGPALDAWASGYYPQGMKPHDFCSLGMFGAGPCQFFFQWVQKTMPSQFNLTLDSILGRGVGHVLAVNSPTDLNVAPADYLPLEAMLGGYPAAKHMIVPDITHLLSPADLSSSRVTLAVLEPLLAFLQEGSPRYDEFFYA
jgi:pimeloyl-ACP methyl ester carboxylesterase